jgi:hypothetical protein
MTPQPHAATRILLFFAACVAAQQPESVPAASPLVAVDGRTIPGPNGSLLFDWVGTAARVLVSNNFTYLAATITDLCAGGNKFVVRLSGEGFSNVDVATFYTRAGTASYTLFGDAGRASFVGASAEVTLIKAVEARFTQCLPEGGAGLGLLSFSTDGAFLPPAPRARRMELIGDSITAGDLLLCTDSAAGAPFAAANALWSDTHAASFGSRACAALGAACTTIAWGGMGLVQNDVLSWTWPTIPDVYPSALAWPVSARGQGAPLDHPWNFSAAPPPDAVVIGLGTNDAAGGFGNATFAARYVAAYVRFVTGIASTYAAARGGKGPAFFLVNATCMTAVYAPSVARVAQLLAAQGAPVQVTVLDLSLPGAARCACGHPSSDQHLAMALRALPVFRNVLGWGG